MIAEKTGNKKAALLAETLDTAIGKYLENSRYPSRKVNEIDNRGSSFYLALYWAQTLAEQDKDNDMKIRFLKMKKELETNENKINEELITVQGTQVDIGGYYLPDEDKTENVMRPSKLLNKIIDEM